MIVHIYLVVGSFAFGVLFACLVVWLALRQRPRPGRADRLSVGRRYGKTAELIAIVERVRGRGDNVVLLKRRSPPGRDAG